MAVALHPLALQARLGAQTGRQSKMLKSSGHWGPGVLPAAKLQLFTSMAEDLSGVGRLLRLITAEWRLAPPRHGQGLPLPMRKYQGNPTGSMTTGTTLSHRSGLAYTTSEQVPRCLLTVTETQNPRCRDVLEIPSCCPKPLGCLEIPDLPTNDQVNFPVLPRNPPVLINMTS